MLSAVAEEVEEETDSLDEDTDGPSEDECLLAAAPNAPRQAPGGVLPSASASSLLAAAAGSGLVPRPGSGCHLTSGCGRTTLLLAHLDPLPFTVRHGKLLVVGITFADPDEITSS